MRVPTSRFLVVLCLFFVPSVLLAHGVTVSSPTSFASLDGSADDHDGVVNGVFTVSDGDLTISAAVDCNDDSGRESACAMAFNVSGDLVVAGGGALYAENRTGSGTGASITLTVGRDLVLQGGAIVSTASRSSSGSTGGAITATVSRHIVVENAATVDAGSANARGGDVLLSAGGAVSVDGNVLSGPSRTILATRLTESALQGGSGNQVGGQIRITTSAFAEPALTVGSTANIVSQGETLGAGPVTLEGCGVIVRGLVAALSRKDAPAKVAIRSGKDLTVDSRDLGVTGATLGRLGRVRADAPTGTAINKGVDLFAADTVTVLGPASASSSLFPITSLAGIHDSKSYGGTIRIISLSDGVAASGNVIDDGRAATGDSGGAIDIKAKTDINLDTAVIRAFGDSSTNNPARGGGSISVRSYSGNIFWRNGLGDVRPTGSASGLPTVDQGAIALTACGTVDTTGSSFPVNGSPTGIFPNVLTGVCTPPAPSLPSGSGSLVACNTPPVANDAAATTNEDTSVTITLSGSDAEGDSLTFSIVSGPLNGSLGPIVPVNSTSATVVYSPNLNFNGIDSFVYQANDGNGGSDNATVVITINPVNDPPSFLAGPTAISLEDAGPQTYANWASSISPGPADESGQTVTFSVTNDNPSLFSVQPALASNGTLTYAAAANAYGSANLTIVAQDNGGTANGGNDTSAAQSGAITITPVNDAPSFTGGGNVSVGEDSGAYSAAWASAISAGPNEGGQSVSFSTSNGNNALFSVQPSISPAGVLSFTPAANANGTATVTVTLSDDGGTANGGVDTSTPQTFTISVSAVNDPPSFTSGGDVTVLEDSGAYSAAWASAISPGPADESGQSVSFNASNDNNALFSVQPSISPAGVLSFTVAADAYGSATVTVTLTDDGGGADTSAPQTFTLTVTPVNDAPSFTAGGNVTVAEDSAAYSAAWASAISAGPNEGGQSVSFSTSNDNNALFSVQPSVSPSGVLTFTLAANANGSATVTVTLSDNGGTANGGVDTSAAQTFTITVTAVNDPPSFVSGGDVTVFEDSGAYSAAWATGISAGPADESGQTVSFNVLNNNNSLFAVQPSISPAGVLSFTLAADAFGSATVTVTLTDNGGGSDTSPAQTFTITVNGVNDAPSFTSGGNVSVNEDSGAYSASWASAISAGPGESGQTLSFSASNDNNALFSAQPQVSASGVLTFTPAPNASGSATVSVFLQDNGGTANGGVDTSATVTFTITITPVNDPPAAGNDSYQTVGNTLLQVASAQTVANPAVFVVGSVLANDTDVDSGSLTATLVVGSVTPGAVVTMNADGTFTYLPAANYAVSDSFSYQVSDGAATSTGTVSITLVGRVWYVDNTASGDGRSSSPFSTLAAGEAASVPNDTVFVFTGNGTTAGQNAGFVMKNGQRLIGQGVALTVPVSVNGGPNPTVLLAAGTKPKMSNFAGNGVTAGAVSNVTVAGLEIVGAFADGINVANASNVAVDTVAINGSLGNGISGTSVVGFQMKNSTVTGNGDNAAVDEAGVAFVNLTGVALVSNSTFSGSVEDNFRVRNSAGSLNRITFTNVTFASNHALTGNDGLHLAATGGTMNVTIEDSFFTGAAGDLFQLQLSGNSTSSDLVFRRNAVSNNHPGIVSGGGGVSISGGGGLTSPSLTYLISQNTFRDAVGSALAITRASGAGVFRGTIDGNTIGVSGVANSGSSAGSGIFMTMVGGGSHTTAVTNNVIRQYFNHGIFMQAGNASTGGNGTLNATVTGNTISQPGSGLFAQNGFQLNSGVSSTGPDAHFVCLTLASNNLTGSGNNGGTDFFLRQRFSTTVRLPGYAGANNDTAAVVSFVQSNNAGSPTGLATVNTPPGGGFVGGAACTLP